MRKSFFLSPYAKAKIIPSRVKSYHIANAQTETEKVKAKKKKGGGGGGGGETQRRINEKSDSGGGWKSG